MRQEEVIAHLAIVATEWKEQTLDWRALVGWNWKTEVTAGFQMVYCQNVSLLQFLSSICLSHQLDQESMPDSCKFGT
ncbi:hypothetical protein Y1Q_0007522 [Alligator mississippiensis]|uniref:Uncharacterized protein n=1 Tax=Alligator mississippiensis TaxID=8496 RepID=A0A151M506_ALLMI|nr:hypothetical protein Y1Q_0007522 [Alligator mississippiensis]